MHPILLQFGPVQIRYYGLMYVISILFALYIIKKETLRKGLGLSDDDVTNFVLSVVVGGIFGARIYYVIFNWDYYGRFVKEIPAIWHGGLAIHGGLIGGISMAYLYLKKHKVPFWKMADAVAPAIILGQSFGRFGNFMNGDAHGTPTDLPWGVVFPENSIAGNQFPGIPIHPVMLYEMVINLAIFVLLWLGIRKKGYKDGFVFSVYLVLYSIGRFFVESFRADSLMLGRFRTAQVISLLIVAIVTPLILRLRLWEKADL